MTPHRKTTSRKTKTPLAHENSSPPVVSAVALPQMSQMPMQNEYHAYLEGRTREQLIAECKRLHALSSQLEVTCRTHLMLGMR